MMYKGVVNITHAQPIKFQSAVEIDCALFVKSFLLFLGGLFNARLLIIDTVRLDELDMVEAAVDGVE